MDQIELTFIDESQDEDAIATFSVTCDENWEDFIMGVMTSAGLVFGWKNWRG